MGDDILIRANYSEAAQNADLYKCEEAAVQPGDGTTVFECDQKLVCRDGEEGQPQICEFKQQSGRMFDLTKYTIRQDRRGMTFWSGGEEMEGKRLETMPETRAIDISSACGEPAKVMSERGVRYALEGRVDPSELQQVFEKVNSPRFSRTIPSGNLISAGHEVSIMTAVPGALSTNSLGLGRWGEGTDREAPRVVIAYPKGSGNMENAANELKRKYAGSGIRVEIEEVPSEIYNMDGTLNAALTQERGRTLTVMIGPTEAAASTYTNYLGALELLTEPPKSEMDMVSG